MPMATGCRPKRSGNTPAGPARPRSISFGDDKAQLEQYGWFNKNAGGMAQPVALKRPNSFGLFDMHGNAYEWCQDWYDGKWYQGDWPSDPTGPSSGRWRVLRGGFVTPKLLTAAVRIATTARRRTVTPTTAFELCERPMRLVIRNLPLERQPISPGTHRRSKPG